MTLRQLVQPAHGEGGLGLGPDVFISTWPTNGSPLVLPYFGFFVPFLFELGSFLRGCSRLASVFLLLLSAPDSELFQNTWHLLAFHPHTSQKPVQTVVVLVVSVAKLFPEIKR